jgi:hypothetical protein
MRIAIAAVLICFSFPSLACEIDHPCEINLLIHPEANPLPVKWMHDALKKYRVCSTLMAMSTVSSGQKDKYHKLGKRDTLVVVPKRLETAASTDIIYWFHGLTGFSEGTFKKRLAPQYSWLVNKQNWPAILVVTEMPWSRFTRTQWKRQGQVFRRKDEFFDYTKEVEGRIKQLLGRKRQFKFNRIIVGHSAGGSAIASAALYGGLCKTNPIGVVFSDSTYGRWFDRAWSGCLEKHRKKRDFRIVVLGQSFGKPWKNYVRWKKRNRRDFKYIEAYRLPRPWTHGKIGHNAVPFFYYRFTTGKYENIY